MMSDEETVKRARLRIKTAYAKINTKKQNRKLIVLTSAHIEHDIANRKRRTYIIPK